MILICFIADDDHFGHVIKVMSASLLCPFLINILCTSALNHVDILIPIGLSVYLYPFIMCLYLYIYVDSLLPILSDGLYLVSICISLLLLL